MTGPAVAQSQPAKYDWRDLTYADLRLPNEAARSYAQVWADHLAKNNAFYAAQGDTRFAAGNAPAVSAAFVVRSPTKTVVLSVFNAVSVCRSQQFFVRQNVTVKRCPMRVSIYENGENSILDAGNGCFLEFGDPSRAFTSDREAGSYAAYDIASRTIRTGMVIGGQAVSGCDLSIPVPRSVQ